MIRTQEPTFDVLPNPSWFDPSKICVLDPWGHLAQTKFKAQIDAGIDIRPTLSITRAHLKIAELDDAAAKGRFPIDGKIVIPSAAATLAESLTTDSAAKLDPQATEVLNSIKDSAGVEVNVSKVAFENVWYLPGVADRLGVSEPLLRRCLFEDTGGMCECSAVRLSKLVRHRADSFAHCRPGTPHSTRPKGFPPSHRRRDVLHLWPDAVSV